MYRLSMAATMFPLTFRTKMRARVDNDLTTHLRCDLVTHLQLWSRCYKTFFMLISAEHDFVRAQISLECYLSYS